MNPTNEPLAASSPQGDEDFAGDDADAPLMQALEQYQAGLDAGHQPDRLRFLEEHAAIADELGPCLESLHLMHTGRPRLEGRLSRFLPPPAPDGSEAIQPAIPLGDFRIVREIGRRRRGARSQAPPASP